PVVILDGFDEKMRRSQRLLLEAEGWLELLMPDGGVVAQPAGRGGGFVADFAEGDVKQALANVSPLRALLPVGTGELRRAELALADDEGKTQARAVIRIITATGGDDAVVLALQGLRGYEKALGRLRAHVEACGGVPLSPRGLYARLFPG